jgi:chromosome segregation ATPase
VTETKTRVAERKGRQKALEDLQKKVEHLSAEYAAAREAMLRLADEEERLASEKREAALADRRVIEEAALKGDVTTEIDAPRFNRVLQKERKLPLLRWAAELREAKVAELSAEVELVYPDLEKAEAELRKAEARVVELRNRHHALVTHRSELATQEKHSRGRLNRLEQGPPTEVVGISLNDLQG